MRRPIVAALFMVLLSPVHSGARAGSGRRLRWPAGRSLAETTTCRQLRAELVAGELQQRDEQLTALQAPQPESGPTSSAVVAAAPPRALWWRRWFQP